MSGVYRILWHWQRKQSSEEKRLRRALSVALPESCPSSMVLLRLRCEKPCGEAVRF